MISLAGFPRDGDSSGRLSPAVRAADARFVPLQGVRLAEVMALERRLYTFPWSQGNFQDALRAGYPSWLAVDTRDCILAYGVAMLAVDEAHLLNLAVDPAVQRCGLGMRLLTYLANRMYELGARSLLLEVRPTNVDALRLYRRFGFHDIGLRKGYYPARWGREDAIVMRAILDRMQPLP